MGISEALIIYLAFGTPLGVYAIVRAKSSLKQELAALLALNILFWPVLASLELVPKDNSANGPKYFADGASRPTGVSASVSSKFERFGDREFRREALDDSQRLEALSNALSVQAAETPVIELYEIAHHSNAKLATKCIARINRRKLSEHRDRSLSGLKQLETKLDPAERADYASLIDSLEVSETAA